MKSPKKYVHKSRGPRTEAQTQSREPCHYSVRPMRMCQKRRQTTTNSPSESGFVFPISLNIIMLLQSKQGLPYIFPENSRKEIAIISYAIN